MLMPVWVLLVVPVLAWVALYPVVRTPGSVPRVVPVPLGAQPPASAVWCPEAPVRVWVRLRVLRGTRLRVWVVR
ncbi:hypothetical protein EBN03_29095 [Nocardia stercoris]|uniref:Uncharacterized protein n=1 Tax=Nocardia stercoris TaxID=2483361 RepID=A0A3M2KSQ6_9NOCA|nr:hypothetical protein EBN03_29095 [Nocardia stercoris]